MTNKTVARLAGVALLSCIVGTSARAQVPQRFDYQAYLSDSAGQPLDTAVAVTFSLYAVETGGTPLWTDAQVVVPSQGLFSTTLGDGGVPFPAGLFDTPLWVGITIEADGEMTPRKALSATAYAQRAQDAETLGGLTPLTYDQSTEVAQLQTDVATAQSGVTSLQADVAGTQTDIGVLQGDVGANQTDIGQLQTDLAATNSDLTTVEATLPTLQTRVLGVCNAGSSIRSILSSGGVNCEVDDLGPWAVFNGNAYFSSGRVGIGTSAPAAGLQIDASVGVDPLHARVQAVTKLRVHSNGSLSVGTSSAGPTDGLYVLGDTGLGTTSAAARLSVSDVDWQMTLNNSNVGGTQWYVGSSADAWAAGGGKFLISPSSGSNNAALAIDASKNVGIGTLSPATRLHLAGGSDVTPTGGGYLTIGSPAGSNIAIDSNEIMARSSGAATTLALNAEGGDVTINSGAGGIRFQQYDRFTGGQLEVTETQILPPGFEEGWIGTETKPFYRTHSWTFRAGSPLNFVSYSDRALKRDVQPIGDALNIIDKLEGVTYELLRHPADDSDRVRSAKEEFNRRNQLGFIAQDLERVLPQLVTQDESSGLKAVGYMGVIPVLVEAVKAQQRQAEAQQRQIDAQRQEIDELKRLLR